MLSSVPDAEGLTELVETLFAENEVEGQTTTTRTPFSVPLEYSGGPPIGPGFKPQAEEDKKEKDAQAADAFEYPKDMVDPGKKETKPLEEFQEKGMEEDVPAIKAPEAYPQGTSPSDVSPGTIEAKLNKKLELQKKEIESIKARYEKE